jgi:hypothetical protein
MRLDTTIALNQIFLVLYGIPNATEKTLSLACVDVTDTELNSAKCANN